MMPFLQKPGAVLLIMCAGSLAQVTPMDGGRYSIDTTTDPMTLILNSTWYREFARNSDDLEECPVAQDTDVVVFNVKTPWSGTEPLAVALWQSWAALFQWLNFKVAIIGPKHMLDPGCGGRLRELGVKIFTMPGGDTQLYGAFEECRDHIQTFLRDGGLYVGSCGGFGYLSSLSHNMKSDTEASFTFLTTMLDVIPSSIGPVFDLGNMTPLDGQTPADVMKLPNGGPYSGGAAVLAQLSDGRVGGYAGGFPNATVLPEDADILQRFSQVDGEPIAAVHVRGEGRNVLGFVYHPEFELGLPEAEAANTGLFARQVLQPGDTHDLPMLQFKMWKYFAGKLLMAMGAANLTVDPAVAVPDTLRYRSPRTGIVWKMVAGEPALVQEEQVV